MKWDKFKSVSSVVKISLRYNPCEPMSCEATHVTFSPTPFEWTAQGLCSKINKLNLKSKHFVSNTLLTVTQCQNTNKTRFTDQSTMPLSYETPQGQNLRGISRSHLLEALSWNIPKYKALPLKFLCLSESMFESKVSTTITGLPKRTEILAQGLEKIFI